MLSCCLAMTPPTTLSPMKPSSESFSVMEDDGSWDRGNGRIITRAYIVPAMHPDIKISRVYMFRLRFVFRLCFVFRLSTGRAYLRTRYQQIGATCQQHRLDSSCVWREATSPRSATVHTAATVTEYVSADKYVIIKA